MTFTVFSQSGCQPCRGTIRLLDQLGVEYEVRDVREDPAAEAVVRDLGYNGTPVVVTSTGKHWQGHRPDRIKELIA